jgi:hypothetical protein
MWVEGVMRECWCRHRGLKPFSYRLMNEARPAAVPGTGKVPLTVNLCARNGEILNFARQQVSVGFRVG